MAFPPGARERAAYFRWRNVPAWRRSAHGRMMVLAKIRRYAHRTQSLNGHWRYMVLCKRYKRILGRELGPGDRAYIQSRHAAEIAASGHPLPESNRLAKRK